MEYEKISKILERSRTKVTTVMATIVRLSLILDVKARVHAIEEDLSDNHVLACAKESSAHFIVSGDWHLLQLREFRKTKIVTASEFIKMKGIHRKAKAERMVPLRRGLFDKS